MSIVFIDESAIITYTGVGLMDNLREQRKIEHIKNALNIQENPILTGFSDVHFVHQAILTGDWNSLETKTTLFGKTINMPIMVNALTGGATSLEKVNCALARCCHEMGIPMAVGSQTVAINKPELMRTFSIVRKNMPHGVVIANVSGLVEPEVAVKAVEMLEADALQLHLNGPQEIVMTEGDRDFSRLEENLLKIKEVVEVPIIIKEVGFGLAKETVEKIIKLGFHWVDIGGAGGTNFIAIEANRAQISSNLTSWGIPTAISLVEASCFKENIKIICTGGISNGLEAAKALGLGADIVGLAGAPLKVYYEFGEEELVKYLANIGNELKQVMLLTGIDKISDFSLLPMVITGFAKDWLNERGFDTKKICQKNRC